MPNAPWASLGPRRRFVATIALALVGAPVLGIVTGVVWVVSWPRAAATTTAVLVLLTGCGGSDDATDAGIDPGALSGESSCKEFLAGDDAERSQALRQVAAEVSAPNAVTPAGSIQVDFTCAESPDLTLVDAVGRLAADPSAGDGDATAGAEAMKAAEVALSAMLSYDWKTFDADRAAAQAVSTPAYWAEAASLWDVVGENVAVGQTTTEATVVEIAPIVEGPGTGEYSASVNQTTVRDGHQTSRTSTVRVTVVEVDGVWLLDDIAVRP